MWHRGRRWTLLDVVITLGGLFFTFLWFAPILWMIVTSLKPTEQILSVPPNWIPQPVTLMHYEQVLQQPIGRWYVNTLIIASVTTLLTLCMGATAGYAFARLQFFGRNLLFWLVLATLMVPFEITLIPLYRLVGQLQLSNTYWSIILPGAASAFSVYLFRQFFLTLPRELEDAAAIDGCGLWGRFFRIILPLSTPAILTVGILSFADSFNQYLWPLLMSNSDDIKTLPVGIAQFSPSLAGSVNITRFYGMGAAAATLQAIPSLIVFFVLQRYFMAGAITSGLKG
jgi:ABC-type glycerol-3-phosphate transport system permease component